MGTSASFALARKIAACLSAALLSFALMPASALAWAEEPIANASVEEAQESDSIQADKVGGASPEADVSASADSSAQSGALAASLIGKPASFVNADVALDGEPVIGSFTIDGLTFAVTEGSNVELVGVSGPEAAGSTRAASEAEAEGSASESTASIIALPESVAYDDAEYAVTSIGAYAFYLSGVTSVELPASVVDVDDRTLRSSDVASVTVAEGNPAYSSFDGALYSADRSSLLLIPEGKQGAVLLPKETEVAEAGKFSHCSLVEAISAEGGAAFASENGLLYDASLTTLLRVPAGATDIAIREGCTTIAAGAMEGCAKLATINAPASVTSISPDVFTSVPTVSLPALVATDDADDSAQAEEGKDAGEDGDEAVYSVNTQLTALVALSSIDDDLPEIDTTRIQVVLSGQSQFDGWLALGVRVDEELENIGESVGAQHAVAYSSGAEGDQIQVFGTEDMYVGWIDSSRESFLDCHLSMTSPRDWAHKVYEWRYTGSAVYIRNTNGPHYIGVTVVPDGVDSLYIGTSPTLSSAKRIDPMSSSISLSGVHYFWLNPEKEVLWDANGGSCDVDATMVLWGESVQTPMPSREGYVFKGWFTDRDGSEKWCDGGETSPAVGDDMTLYAQWGHADCDLVFDTSSEPGDEDYPGMEKPDETIAGSQIDSADKVEIEDPKRPGYVFQGWVIPDADGEHAIDQKLVYQDETDGRWYVDASKLPDYATDGRVELTARWTSVISVDVPSAVTFYADVVTQGNESREGAVDGAFGQNKVASQSKVDLRIVGLESTAVETQGSTLGADSILKKATSVTPSSSTQKLFSLYPTDEALTADDLQDPDSVSAAKPTDAVDFALDDILLEKSFAADKFTIPAGDTLNLGYRLNLSETGTELDYDKLATLDEGQSASIANISYCFAADALIPTGSKTDPIWIENTNPAWGVVGVYGLNDIKAAADSLALYVTAEPPDAATNPSQTDIAAYWDEVQEQAARSPYYSLYKHFLEAQVMEDGEPSDGPYFQLKVAEAIGDGYLPVQLIGICQDTKSVGGKAGLTFQMRDSYANSNTRSAAAGGGAFGTYLAQSDTNRGGWESTVLRTVLQTTFWNYLPSEIQLAIVEVDKHQQLSGGISVEFLQNTEKETVWLPSLYEVFGTAFENYNDSEALLSISGYVPFQYQAYQGNEGSVSNAKATKRWNESVCDWWVRTAIRSNDFRFSYVNMLGERASRGNPTRTLGVAPAFCF